MPSLREKLLSASSSNQVFEIAEEWLLRRFDRERTPPSYIRTAIDHIIEDPLFVTTDLNTLISDSRVSHKHFIHQFRRFVGPTPKYYQRVMRFNEILPRIINKERVSWTSISYECGYYDQSHFIRDFRTFSGYGPGEFLDGDRDDRVNYFPVA